MRKINLTKVIAVLLVVCTCAALTACTVTTTSSASNAQGTVTQAAATQNMNYVSSYSELVKAQPTIIMNDAPTGSTNVAYGWMTNIPVINEITFTYNGINYVYRAAACPGGVASADISNVTADLKGVTSVNLNNVNEAGGTYVLRYSQETGEGVANWTSDLSKCQYSLYTPNGCTGDVQNMPMTKVMQNIFTAAADAKVASGNTVLAVINGTMTITTSGGASAVIDCSYISTVDVKAQDVIDLVYSGDLAGNAYAIKITKTGQASQSSQTTGTVISGTVYQVDATRLYLLTADNNVYIISLSGNTKISGAATALAANQEVKVTYSGDLNSGATATAVEIVKQGSGSSDGKTTSYTERTVYGTVTSVAGNLVTVQGILFTVNSSYCYVSGYAQVGVYATINYRDYGNGNYEVTSAYFGNVQPTASPYTDRTCCGYITYANGIYIGVEGGYDFVVNGANCYVSGTAQVGGYARIDYRDYGYGNYDVTAAYFTPPEDDTPELCTAYGTVDGPVGSTVSIGGVSYIVDGSTTMSGTPEQRGTATIWYNLYPDGRKVATNIEFYPAENPDDYDVCSAYGTVDGPVGSSVSIGGVSYTVDYNTTIVGTAEERGSASIQYAQYRDGRRVALYIEFYPAYTSDEGVGDLIVEEPDWNYDDNGNLLYEQGDLIDDEFAAT